MATLFTNAFIEECVKKYYEQEVVKVQQESNFQLVFTNDKLYDLDELILLRRRDVGNAPFAIHYIDREDDYIDVSLVFLAIEHILFNEDENYAYYYEQQLHTKLTHPVIGLDNTIVYEPYNLITDIPNYVNIIQAVLDPQQNEVLLQYLYEQIPSQIREKDGLIQINTEGDKTFFDILDIDDPDNVL